VKPVLREVLAVLGIDGDALEVKQLDQALAEIANSRSNRSRFASALQTIQKNWCIPINDRWTKPE